MGHEFSGTVEAVGEGVTDVAIGDSAVVEPYFVCDQCAPCRAGNYHLCTTMGFIGLAGGGGGLSEKVVVDRRWVHKIGGIPLDQAALIQPLSVAHHAVSCGGVKTGDVALVAGAGTIGLLVAAMLKSLGVRTIVTELSHARKAKALSSGVADYVLDPTSQDVREQVLKLTVGADIGFECAGSNEELDLRLDAVRPAGVIVNVSIWGQPATVDMQKAGPQRDRPARHHRLRA